MIFQTERLILREMTMDDYEDIAKILQNKDVMYAYEHAFNDKEVEDWINNQIRRYKEDGFGLWAVILKEENKIIGQCGLTIQKVNEDEVVEIGYLFNKDYWKKGYAIESAKGCKEYAFNKLKINQVYSIIRDNNISSQNVALKNGMKIVNKINKFYYNVNMPHLVFSVKNEK